MTEHKERELVAHLCNNNIPTIRIGGSGAGTDRKLPDVMIYDAKSGNLYVVEHKYSSGDYAYFTEEEIGELLAFADEWDAVALAVARFSRDVQQHFVPARDLEFNGNDSVSLKRHETDEYGELAEVLDGYEGEVVKA